MTWDLWPVEERHHEYQIDITKVPLKDAPNCEFFKVIPISGGTQVFAVWSIDEISSLQVWK